MMKLRSNLPVLVLALLISQLFVSIPAHAGHWVLTFNCNGQTTETRYGYIGGTGTTSTTTKISWPALVSPELFNNNPNSVYFGASSGHFLSSICSGTIAPVLTWTLDTPTDSSKPPLTATIQESCYAQADTENNVYSPIFASDGLNDPDIPTISLYLNTLLIPPGYGETDISSGLQIVSQDTGGNSIVTFPALPCMVEGGVETDNGGNSSLFALSVAILYPVTATSTAGTTDPRNPAWFSGTACTATGTADLGLLYGGSIPQGDFITSATLSVGGTVVKSYPDDYIGVLPSTGLTSVSNLAVMWDSTHFATSMTPNPIMVEVEVHDAIGKGYKAHLTAPVYNKALALANNTFGDTTAQDSVLAVVAAAKGANYETDFNDLDTVTDILAELPDYTAFYIDTHGYVGGLADCYGDGSGNSGSHLFGAMQVSQAIGGITSKGVTTGGKGDAYPPYNFVMFDACIVMGDKFDSPNDPDSSDLSSAFGIPGSAGTDRAALGWDWYILANDENVQWTKRLWNFLADGIPLRTAATLDSAYGDAQGEIGPPFNGTTLFHYTSINPVIQGDPKMRLHGVYGELGFFGEDLPGITPSWYRPLQY